MNGERGGSQRFVAIAVLACCVLSVLPGNAFGAFPGDNGKIVFDSYPPGIETINPDGSGRARLTSDGEEPAWSPSGDRIAFVSQRDGNYEIYVMNADGSGQTRLTNDPANDYSPAWSPDGTKIAFTSFRSPGGIYVMNADGTNQTHLIGGGQPDWSPDGTKIAFITSVNYATEPAVINVDGTGFRRLSTPWWYVYPDPSEGCFFYKQVSDPDWSPDGQKIVFTQEEQEDCFGTYANMISTIDADGTGARILYEDDTNYQASPAWSPDGSLIVAVKIDVEMFLIDSNGGYVRTLVGYSPTGAAHNPDWQTVKPPGYSRPRGASPTSVMLVPAYEPCSSANASHGPPLATGSCSPPVPASNWLTIGSPDANGAAAKASGFVQFESVCNPPAPSFRPPCTEPGDQIDAVLTASLTDVRNTSALTDYTGELRVSVPARITDRFNGAGNVHPGTASDFTLDFNMNCVTTPDNTVGSTCSTATSVDAVMPGLVLEGKRAVWQLGRVEVYDGGADGDADTAGDNTLFMEQGLFVP